MKRRTDAERRAALELINLQHEADRLGHERDLLRVELAAIVRAVGRGWRDPEAVELAERIRAIHREWEYVIERAREAKTTLWALKEDQHEHAVDR